MGNTPSTPGRHQNQGEHEAPQPPQPPAAPPQNRQQQQQESQNNQTHHQNFTCEICIEPMLLPNKLFKNRSKCAHPFCTDCMIKYIQAKLEDNIAKIPCPALNCSQFLDPLTCRRLVGPELFVRWCDALCETALMGFARSYCPNRNCSALIVNECGGNVKKAVCPGCKRPFCFQCKLPWHSGFRCEESAELRDRNDRAFGVLAEQKKWMRCPQCHHFVELIDGCRIVKCRCRASFCYNCGRQVHQHWCGCDGTSRCRVWCYQIAVILAILVSVFLPVSMFLLFQRAQKHGSRI